MTDWITDRRPTDADADQNSCVWITQEDGRVIQCAICNVMRDDVACDIAWTPISPPTAFIPPKKKRRETDNHLIIGVLPTDPADWDAFLEAVDAWLEVCVDSEYPLPPQILQVITTRQPSP